MEWTIKSWYWYVLDDDSEQSADEKICAKSGLE